MSYLLNHEKNLLKITFSIRLRSQKLQNNGVSNSLGLGMFLEEGGFLKTSLLRFSRKYEQISLHLH